MQNKQSHKNFSLLPKIINGSIAGVIGMTSVFPLDLIKTRLQNQREGPNQLYKNWLDCGIKTFKHEGFFGLYRGCLVNIVLITPEKAIKLAGNDYLRHKLTDRKTGKITLPREMLAAAGAGTAQSVVTTPMELLKIQLQDAGRSDATNNDENNKNKSNGKSGKSSTPAEKVTAISVTKKLLKEKGVRGLFKGFTSTTIRDVVFSIVYFPMFAHLNARGKRKEGRKDAAAFHVSFLSGVVAGIAGCFCCSPFDVVKTRRQLLEQGKGEESYKSMSEAFVKIFKKEGVTAFFKGTACRMMVVAPLFGIAQVVYFLNIGEKLLGYED